jgi:lambda family phage tail tape measure protein
MILQLTIQKVIMQILGAINPAPAAGLNFADMAKYSAPLPGFAKGGAFGKNGIVPFAYGGIVNKPTLFQFANGGTAATGLLGEAGPEAILPLRRGPSGRLGVETSGAASSMNVTVNVDASGTKAEGDGGRAEQLGRVVSQAVQAELIKQKRPGGLLA